MDLPHARRHGLLDDGLGRDTHLIGCEGLLAARPTDRILGWCDIDLREGFCRNGRIPNQWTLASFEVVLC